MRGGEFASAHLMDEENPPNCSSMVLTRRADISQYLSQPQTENWPKAAEDGGKKLPGELTIVVRITCERADGKPASERCGVCTTILTQWKGGCLPRSRTKVRSK